MPEMADHDGRDTHNLGSANVAKIKAASSNAGWFNARPSQTCAR